MYEQHYAPSTLTSHVSALSFVHKLLSVDDPGEQFIVKKMLQGCRKLNPKKDGRLPITKSIMSSLMVASGHTITNFITRTRFKAMCALAFHALLRIGEMTISHNNLQVSNVRLERNLLTLQFTQFKHSDGSTSTHSFKAQPMSTVCPVRLLSDYLFYRGPRPGPLFLGEDGRGVERRVFAAELKATLLSCGFNTNRYTSHSFRIGAASAMAAKGASDAQIRQAGRWSSNAFLSYIR